MEWNWNDFVQSIVDWLKDTGVKIVIALVAMILCFKLANLIFRRIEKRADKRSKLDKTLYHTLFYIAKIAVKVLVVCGVIAYLGIDTSGMTALIASLGVGAGLAVNGTLSNFAGGMLLLVTRPFRIGDYIEAQSYAGTVEEIRIINTKIRTPDNKVVYLPNGNLSTACIVNYSEKGTRRLAFEFSISYSEDFERAKAVIAKICNEHPLVLKTPEPFVRVSKHNESSIDITARVWVGKDDYWAVNFDILEAVKKAFDENGIEIPFKQVDVHIKEK